MVYGKRLGIAVIMGIICGLLCAVGGKTFAEEQMTNSVMWSLIFNRAFIGFAIGISAWRLGWVLHGIVIGFLGTLAMSVYGDVGDFFMISIFGILWGFLIDLFTTVVFKAPMKQAEAPPE